VQPTDAARAALERVRSSSDERPLGLYVHVPFCARRCGYCAFNTVAVGDEGDPDAFEHFVQGAIGEIRLAGSTLGHRPPVTSVYFGGGTPTMLAARSLQRLLVGMVDNFALADDAEVTVEANPDGLRPGQLEDLRELGVNRVSFGMQSTSRRVLQTLDRTHDPELALRSVEAALRAGFDNISLDLIYGTPGETADDWAATLEAATGSGVDHISAYALSVEPSTKLAARVRSGALPQPDADEAAARYLEAERRLTATGFEWYEISNWARSEAARSRHNQLYWRNDHWWGVGPGAHSHVAGVRWSNVDDLTRWASSADAGQLDWAGYEVLDREQMEFERVMLGLRLADGLELATDAQAAKAHELATEGLVRVEDERAVLTLKGRLLADHVVLGLT
jgi:putative oxygen-independent coproporphyrinogen III oxidase